jgi:uncharacterized Fe-S radical SAM superfamily protein PflX
MINPCRKTLSNIRNRCNPDQKYGKRGIRCFITLKELEYLWGRDKAYLLKKPSIDRIDNTGDYTIENCRYIEHSENAKLGVYTKRKYDWSERYEKCLHCGRVNRKYKAKGLCFHCYKKLWQPKKWSMKNECCIICGTTLYAHTAKGKCSQCYNRELARIKYGWKPRHKTTQEKL